MASRTVINSSLEYSLRLFGVWPQSSYPILKTTIWSAIMLSTLVFQCWYCIANIETSLTELLDGLSITLSNSIIFLKLIVMWFHTRTFSDIMTAVLEDCNGHTSTIEEKQIMTGKAALSSRISNSLLGYYAIVWLSYSGLALVLDSDDGGASVSKGRQLLMRMKFPFDATVSPRYEIILALQFIFESIIVYGAAACLSLIIALILHVGSQIDLCCHRLTEISFNYNRKEVRHLVLKDIIIRHHRIIRMSKNIETMFNSVSLYQFLLNMLVICFVSFILVISLRTEDKTALVIKCFPYYIVVNCEAFVLCYTGEYLASKSETISESVYTFFWYELEPKEARSVLLLILRSQSPLILTAGKFVQLSLEAFANMLKASASYVSVLYAMY